jgi:stage II sporulation protein AA (anti-sigma F factor antagonist)
MSSSIRVLGDIMIVNLKGELDHYTAFLVKNQMEENMMKFPIKKILFNFKNVSFMDSSGIGMIIGRYKALQRTGGKVAVAGLNAQVKRIFEMAGLFGIVACYNDEKEAIDKLKE